MIPLRSFSLFHFSEVTYAFEFGRGGYIFEKLNYCTLFLYCCKNLWKRTSKLRKAKILKNVTNVTKADNWMIPSMFSHIGKKIYIQSESTFIRCLSNWSNLNQHCHHVTVPWTRVCTIWTPFSLICNKTYIILKLEKIYWPNLKLYSH